MARVQVGPVPTTATTRPRRAMVFGCLITLVGLILVIGPARPAGAAGATVLTCAGTQEVTIKPGLRLQPRDVKVTITTTYSGCVAPGMPELSSGASQASSFMVPQASCLGPLVELGPGAKVIQWNIRPTSTFSFNRIGSNVGGSTVVTEAGTISSGLFAGSSALEVVVSPALNLLACLSSKGVTSRLGAVTFTVTGL